MAKYRRREPRTYTFEEKVSLVRRIDELLGSNGARLKGIAEGSAR